MKNAQKTNINRVMLDIVIVISSCAIGAFGIVAVMIPNGLTYGGISGIARLVQTTLKIDYNIMFYALSLTVLMAVWITLGLKDVKKILAMSIIYPAMTVIFTKIGLKFNLGHDQLMAAILLGVSFGVSYGISFYGGFSSGGTDSVGKIIKMRIVPHVGLSKITTLIDFLIVSIQAVILGPRIAVYALVSMFTAMKIADMVLYGFSSKLIRMTIITREPDKLVEHVIQDMHRGVSSNTMIGEFTGEARRELIIYCTVRESFEIKRYLSMLDSRAFVTVMQVKAVWGEGKGFSDIEEQEEV